MHRDNLLSMSSTYLQVGRLCLFQGPTSESAGYSPASTAGTPEVRTAGCDAPTTVTVAHGEAPPTRAWDTTRQGPMCTQQTNIVPCMRTLWCRTLLVVSPGTGTLGPLGVAVAASGLCKLRSPHTGRSLQFRLRVRLGVGVWSHGVYNSGKFNEVHADTRL